MLLQQENRRCLLPSRAIVGDGANAKTGAAGTVVRRGRNAPAPHAAGNQPCASMARRIAGVPRVAHVADIHVPRCLKGSSACTMS